jgi:hypothetical protein
MYQLKKGWQLTGNGSIIGKMPNDLQVTANGMVTYGFGVSKSLLNDHLSLSASANNPFRQYRNNIATTIGPDFGQVASTREYFAQYSVSLNYRFGKMKGNINKATRGINNNDVSN